MLARKYVQIVKKTESMLLCTRIQVMTGVSELSKFSNYTKKRSYAVDHERIIFLSSPFAISNSL